MRTIRELDSIEIRVLGALMEKEQATPDYYPLTVNALLAACNQKSNREPVTELTETEVVEALERLRRDVLAWRSDGARAEKWSQSVSRRLELTHASKALLTLLMLRGPQTPGELRARSGRLHPFADLAEVDSTLRGMASRDFPLVAELERRPGSKESRWTHRLAAGPAPEEAGGSPPSRLRAPAIQGVVERLETVERRLDELAGELARLRAALGETDGSDPRP